MDTGKDVMTDEQLAEKVTSLEADKTQREREDKRAGYKRRIEELEAEEQAAKRARAESATPSASGAGAAFGSGYGSGSGPSPAAVSASESASTSSPASVSAHAPTSTMGSLSKGTGVLPARALVMAKAECERQGVGAFVELSRGLIEGLGMELAIWREAESKETSVQMESDRLTANAVQAIVNESARAGSLPTCANGAPHVALASFLATALAIKVGAHTLSSALPAGRRAEMFNHLMRHGGRLVHTDPMREALKLAKSFSSAPVTRVVDTIGERTSFDAGRGYQRSEPGHGRGEQRPGAGGGGAGGGGGWHTSYPGHGRGRGFGRGGGDTRDQRDHHRDRDRDRDRR